MGPDSINDFKTLIMFKRTLYYVVLFLPVHMLLVYFFIYVLVPRFVQHKKYISFIIGFFCICTVCFFISFFFARIFLKLTIADPHYHILFKDLFVISFDNTINSGLAVAGFAIGIKLAKNIYQQQKENTRLAEEESDNRIKLMKSGIQPDFLYHSLTNLQKKISCSPDEAPEMILHLSEIFSYILYDCNSGQILLANELAILQHLIAIENINDTQKTGTGFMVHGTIQNKYITPLSLFSVLQQINIAKENAGFYPANADLVINIEDNLISLYLSFKGMQVINDAEFSCDKAMMHFEQHLPDGYLLNKRSDNYFIKAEIPLYAPIAHDSDDMYIEALQNEHA